MTSARWRRRVLASLLTVLLALSAVPVGAGALPATSSGEEVRLQILAINDFHGQITPYSSTLGGAATLSAYLDAREAAARAEKSTTLRLGVGDLIGASPAASALLQDEPTMRVLDKMKFQYSTVGNHEFDEGLAELYRLQYGGYHEATGDWPGTRMQYLAANVVHEDTGETVFEPCVTTNVRGIPVGIIGVVTADTPNIVTASGVEGLEFTDPVDAVNECVDQLSAEGVEAIVVLIHDGGAGDTMGGPVSGSVVPLIEAMDDEVDVALTAHSHSRYWGYVDGKLVTQAHSAGRAFADIDLVLSRETGDVISKTAEIVPTTSGVLQPDPVVKKIVDRAVEQVAPIINAEVAVAADAITRTPSAAGESELGNLIADAQKWKQSTDIALMNPGGIRADLDAGPVTYGELFAVQPFGNYLVTMELTGAEIDAVLEQQWQPTTTRMLQVSGLSYTWSASAPVGSKVSGIMIGGMPVDSAATYTVTVNSFLADGGDGFSVLAGGENKVYFGSDLDALIEYVSQLPQPFNAVIEGRISMVP